MYKCLLLFLLFPLTFYGQISLKLTNDSPRDLQLVARNPDLSNKGIIPIEGTYDKSGAAPDYTSILVKVYKGSATSTYDTGEEDIVYSGDVGTFDFKSSIRILSEKIDYTVKVYGVIGSAETLLKQADRVVAGDVYIIQGQSNGVAQRQEDSSTSDGEKSPYIRVYASGTPNQSSLLGQDAWYEGTGDEGRATAGNTGQWGLKLAKLLLDKYKFPIAIFNGSRGARHVGYFLEDYQEWESGDDADDEFLPNGKMNNNYWRLQYRLERTGLTNSARAVFWSQGERTNWDGEDFFSTNIYVNNFLDLKNSWESEYPGLEQFYIFQTRYCQGCDLPPLKVPPNTAYFGEIMEVKEAQRQLAIGNNDIKVMPTNALNASYWDGDGWHFVYSGGYEYFATRIFELVKRDFYGGSNLADIEAPMIKKAVLTGGTTLTLETDANSLSMDAGITTDDFILGNAGGANLIDIDVDGSNIILTLSADPGINTTISYTAQRVDIGKVAPKILDYPRVRPGKFVYNSTGIELVCFNKFPIDIVNEVLIPTWNGSSWSPTVPTATTDAIIDGNYDASDGSFTARNLTIKSGVVLDFDDSTTNSVIVYGDLRIEGTFNIGDEESLVMYDKDALITGDITKFESSTDRINVHDFTYWSSPVESADAIISNVFPGVNANRIFYYDQARSQATSPDTPGYWDVWVIAPQNKNMTAGMGFAAEGKDNNIHSITFTGKPNNGDVSIPVVFQSGEANDANLIGNPYPSAIDITKFLKDNNVSGAFLWTHKTPITGESGDYVDDYATIDQNGNGTAICDGCPIPDVNIGSSQGFFVNTIVTSSSSFTFTNDMRMEEANDQFFKSANSKTRKKDKDNGVQIDGKIWLNLKTDQGGFNQILIVFKEGLSNKVDPGYDTKKFSNSNNPISFYSVIDKDKYVIQGLRTFAKNRRVKLGFDTSVAPRKFTIAIENTEGALKKSDVYLVDNTLKKTHNLSKSAYEFQQESIGDYPERFVLKFTGDNSDNKDTLKKNKNDFKVHNGSFGMTIRANNRVKRLKVFNIYGKRLINMKPNSKYFTVKTSKIKRGTVVIVEATFKKGEIVRKKTIKY